MIQELGYELLSLEAVQAEILSFLNPLPPEDCALAAAFNRILREDLICRDPLPPFESSAMDGYAVRAGDLGSAAPDHPVVLEVSATIMAGDREIPPLAPGSAIRIMTGATVPEGADAVVPHELTRVEGRAVRFAAPVDPGWNVRPAGGDLKPGDLPLRCGDRLRGPQLALAAALGRTHIQVARPARVAIFSPGDELVEPGEPVGPGRIRSTNQYSLLGFLLELGIEPVDLGIVPDRLDRIREVLGKAADSGADAVISTGGVSAGDRDLVQEIARNDGNPGRVYKVAMRPGKPQAFARINGIPLFGLPGNPASAIISFVVLVRPALRKLLGEARLFPERFPVYFPAPYRYKPGRTFFLRVRVEPDPTGFPAAFRVVEVAGQDSSLLSSFARANALVILPAERDEARPGECFPAIWIYA